MLSSSCACHGWFVTAIIPAVHHHWSHVWGSGCRGSPDEGEHRQSILGHPHVRPLGVVVLNDRPLVLPPFGVPFLTLCVKGVQRRERGRKRSIKISSVLLACSAEKVLDSDRGNLQLCLLLGGDRVRGKIHVGTGNNSKTRTPKQQCT